MLGLLLTTCTSLAVEAVYTRLTGVKFLIMSWAGSKMEGHAIDLVAFWHGMLSKKWQSLPDRKTSGTSLSKQTVVQRSSSLEHQLIRHPLFRDSERCSYRYW